MVNLENIVILEDLKSSEGRDIAKRYSLCIDEVSNYVLNYPDKFLRCKASWDIFGATYGIKETIKVIASLAIINYELAERDSSYKIKHRNVFVPIEKEDNIDSATYFLEANEYRDLINEFSPFIGLDSLEKDLESINFRP